MALPREPRQKMINIMYLVLTAILALNVSAEVINAFKTVDKSLTDSNKNIEQSNGTLFQSLDEKLKDLQTKEKAEIWVPKANQAKKLSDDLYNYVEGLKKQVKMQADLKVDKNGVPVLDKNGNEDFKMDYLEASTRIFEKNGEGKILYQKLADYRKNMLAIDSSIDPVTFPVNLTVPPSHSGNAQTGNPVTDWTASYFHMTPAIAALTMLSKVQNNVKNAENQVVTYCHNQIGAVKLIFNKFQPIASGSSTYLMPGQEMVVTAGVGAFNDAAKPVISIDGAATPLNENGVAERKFNVSGTGNKKVHVSISYTKPDGTIDHLEKDIDYTVGIPGGAAVMLDKMNVFYIGVDNPITISSGSGWDKTNVSITGGTITGTGSNRVVTVTTPGTASITVTAEGKSSKFDFRVKVVPDPVFKVASGKPRMPSVEFKNQQFCRAELEKFDFDTRFSIVSATVYFSGAGFPSVATSSINGNNLAPIASFLTRCGPGSVVTFDNIKVTGPGGQRTIEGRSFALY
ncbi:MAG: gliding motility protein GldM [Chitinophagaceae bacterium]|nr:gliding motility protein GldM [Chitinophagaceae bacterium]